MTFFNKLKIVLMFSMILSFTLLFGATSETTTGTGENSSTSGIKAMTTLEIVAQIEYGTDPTNFIFNRTSGTTFNMAAFAYDIATLEYNHTTYAAANALKLTFPTSGSYQLEAKHYGTSTVTTFTQAMVTGEVVVPLTYAGSSAGMDTSGNPSGNTQNNVLTIVVDKGTGTETTYTLRFRRRAENVPTSITNIVQAGNSFTSTINVATSATNGDAISSYNDVDWSVNSNTGTGYFTGNVLTGLSNGDITVTATLRNYTSISKTSDTITLGGLPDWLPHLGRLELSYPAKNEINITPGFNSNPAATGTYLTSLTEAFSNVRLKLMAPSDCQIFIDGARVSSNGESILRVGPTDPNGTTKAITFNIEVVKGVNTKNYVLNIQREISNRLKYGRNVNPNPHLRPTNPATGADTGADGDVFGMNDATTNKFTVQAWVRWTSDPATSPSWGNIVSQTTSANGSEGSFWLQHNNKNSSFEFAIKPTGPRVYVLSDPTKVTIQQAIWYLVTGVYNEGSVKIFVNDIDVTQSARNTTGNIQASNNSIFNIGKMAHGQRPFSGNIRNVRMWVGEARTLTEIGNDYVNTPVAGSTSDDSDFSWPLNETTNSAVAAGNGLVGLSMSTTVTTTDFVSCCANNREPGQAFVHRPERMDLSGPNSESVILVQAKGYSGSDFRFRILGAQVQEAAAAEGMQAWDHKNDTWKGVGTIATGIEMDTDLGNPATVAGTYFWVPVRRNASTDGKGRYVDDNTQTGYDATDESVASRILYNSKINLPEVQAMGTTFALTGTLKETTSYPTTKKYVILGYDAVEKGRLITGTSSSIAAKDGKAVGSYSLVSDKPLHRIEVRTQDDILVTYKDNETGWEENTDLGDITLPVELSSFTVAAISSGAKLQWVSQTESNLMGYYVYRAESEDLNSANLVSPIIEATNLSQTQMYSFTDIDLQTQVSYYYWLTAVEYSGEFRVYGPINITLAPDDGDIVEIPIVTGLDKLYPNPFNPQINIRYGLKEAAAMKLTFYNLKGQKVHSHEMPTQAKGYHQYTWDASKHSSGIYFVVFNSGKLKEVRKVVLTK